MDRDGYFGKDVAKTYDAVHGDATARDLPAMVSLLAELAQGGAALEFAIGTGRVALPLMARGISVSGIEISAAMVAELRKKETGDPIDVTIGDMTKARMQGDFALVYLVYNTIDNLTSQDAQIACFRNAFAHLRPGGRFVIETLVPPLQQLPFGETKRAFSCTGDHWGIDEFDVVSQCYTSHHIRRRDGVLTEFSVPFRYAWPAELDVMAKLAGFTPESRWADWHRSPFTRLSTSHVSVWQKPQA